MKLIVLATAAASAAALSLRVQPKMSVAVFGATGLTGRECTHQLLERGVPVRALCRDPSKLLTPLGSTGKEDLVENDKLYKYKGSVTNAADVEKVFESGDIEGVIISLGGKTKDVGPTMLTDGTATVIAAMKKYDVKRVAVVTSIGAGDSKDQAPFMFKMLMMTVMSSIFTDKNNQEALFTDGGVGRDLEWCIVRPGGLTVEKPTGAFSVSFCLKPCSRQRARTPSTPSPRLTRYSRRRHQRHRGRGRLHRTRGRR